jgi:hypothetical protein
MPETGGPLARHADLGAADTVNDVKPTTVRLLTAVLAVLAGLVALAAQATPAGARAAGAQLGARPASAASPASAARSVAAGRAAGAQVHPVLIIGLSGLRWSDISPEATPALWRLAEHGSVGSLVVSAVRTRTCPADAWLTLNAGARATAESSAAEPCQRPAVLPAPGRPAAGAAAGASIPAMAGIERANVQYSYNPCWGVLGTGAGPAGCSSPISPGQCATAIGPGAALALASRSGQVAGYETIDAGVRSVGRCPLTVADLGVLPVGGDGPAGRARVQVARAADRTAGRLIAAAPAGAIIVVAGLGDDNAPHLRAIIVSGPGYGAGLLRVASTRQPGMVLVTDLTPSVLAWRGRSVPRHVVGSPILAASRGALPATIRTLTGQDTAAQVYRDTLVPYFLIYGFGEGVVFGLLALILRGADPVRTRRRRAAYRVAGVIAGAVPAGSFLASLVPWPVLPHPALLLYGMGVAWAGVIAAVALSGPWRRDPLGSPGFLGAVTIAVIGVDVITGSHLQLGTPFGLNALAAGRFYGIGNNALGGYALGGILCAAWAARVVLRRTGHRGRAAGAAGAIALVTVIAAGWPGFGAKVGGTIAMVPGFLVLLAAIAGIRITPRRAAVVAVSGLVLIAILAVLSYVASGSGSSDVGAFVGHVLHGGAGPILRRKVSANIGSLAENPATPIVPVVVVVTGLMLAWPERLRLQTVVRAMRAEPLLRPLLGAMWLVGVLGWLADDSGVTVTASALPFALPLVIAIVTGIAQQDAAGPSDLDANARSAPAPDRAG